MTMHSGECSRMQHMHAVMHACLCVWGRGVVRAWMMCHVAFITACTCFCSPPPRPPNVPTSAAPPVPPAARCARCARRYWRPAGLRTLIHALHNNSQPVSACRGEHVST